MSEVARLRALRGSGLLTGESARQFQNQIALVREVLDVPVAIVSLIEEDKQVFAAHLGLPALWAERGETPLTHSFCQHVVADGAPLVVADARADERVKDNLAIDELGVAAYLGVPLALPSGELVGALAAIDSKPRAWSDAELRHLQAVARVVGDEIETRISENKWRSLFDNMQEGVLLGHVVRDGQGKIVDWRYEAVNSAWSELVGIPRDQALGRTVRELIPGIEDDWVSEFARVVETGTPIAFTRQVGTLGRWYDGFVRPSGPDTFVVLFVEVTERLRAQERREALVDLGDRLRDLDTIDAVALTATDILARVLGGTRAGYGTIDAEREIVVILPETRAVGVSSIAGLHRFRDFGTFIEDLKRGERVVIPDVGLDPRTASAAEALRAIDVVALVNLPIMEHGKLVGVMLVQDKDPRPFSSDELLFIGSVADRTQAAVARLKAEADQRLLNQEISHRLKNTLALVQAVATQTLRGVADREPVEAFEKRLHALSSAHDILLRRSWTTAPLATIVLATLQTLGEAGRCTIEGPHVQFGSRSSLSLALLVHELATNAMKYGALSRDEGRVEVSWHVDQGQLIMWWRERGGPLVVEPRRRGFGSRLIRLGLVGSGGVEVFYRPEGFEARMEALLDQVQES